MDPNIDPNLLNLYNKLDIKSDLLPKNLIDNRISKIYAKFVSKYVSEDEKKSLYFLKRGAIDPDNMINYYFDKIYVLNLDRRPDRMENMVRRLARWGIHNYVRFPAIDGVQSPHWEEWRHYMHSKWIPIEKIKYKRKAICSAGSWAILKAMYHMINDAKNNGYKRILVLQDDILFHKNFKAEFAKIPSYIPDTWKLLYLGATQHCWNNIIKSHKYYHPCGTADGAFAVGIHGDLYDELISEIIKFEMPVDSGALRNLQKRYLYNSYVIYPNIMIADIRDSDLRGSRDLENFGKRFGWDSSLYEIDD
jgi:GR25 family glycosyltransferase involved in LPS biosynthesis